MHHGLKCKTTKPSESILWKYTLYDFNYIQFVEDCLMDQDMVYLDEHPKTLKQNVYRAAAG